jgi:hypothetical protein
LAAFVALALGVTCAEAYARLAAPYYAAVDRLIAWGHPWEVTGVEVRPGKSHLTAELQLQANVFRYRGAANRAARVVGRVQVGEVIETALVFWTLLLLWPAASIRQRVIRLIVGMPVFLGLEAITTATQLILPMAQASAMLAGDSNPLTPWDRWSRFLEAGGQFVLAFGFAIPVAATTPRRSVRLSLNVVELEPKVCVPIAIQTSEASATIPPHDRPKPTG